jgi:hypothetical protein
VTLDKTGEGTRGTTRYRDYAISRELFHWESQSNDVGGQPDRVAVPAPPGAGSQVPLSARVLDTDPAFWFLGPCEQLQHRGNRPMAVTWRLRHRMPADLSKSSAWPSRERTPWQAVTGRLPSGLMAGDMRARDSKRASRGGTGTHAHRVGPGASRLRHA